MNIETLAVILAIALVAAIIAQILRGWSLPALIVSYLLACFGAVGGWFAQQRLGLPPLYSIALGADSVPVAVVWPALAALVLALLGAGMRRRRPPVRRRAR